MQPPRLKDSFKTMFISKTVELQPKGSNDSLRLHFYEWGSGDNVVVCAHGLTRNARDFDFLARKLAKNGHRVICIDVPGRGKSQWLKTPADYNYQYYSGVIIDFLKSQNLSQVKWVGTSMGGLIGMVVSAFEPDAISKIVLNDIGPFIPASALERLAKYVGVKTRFANFEEYEKELKTILVGFGIREPEHWQHMLETTAKQLPDGSFEMLYDPAIRNVFLDEDGNQKKIEAADLWKVWSKVKCDALILRGAESDLFMRETADEMLRTHGRARFVEYAATGHAPNLMEDNQIADVASFFSEA